MLHRDVLLGPRRQVDAGSRRGRTHARAEAAGPSGIDPDLQLNLPTRRQAIAPRLVALEFWGWRLAGKSSCGAGAGAAAAESTTTRSFYDSHGSFAGQSFTRGNSTSFSDGQGRFSGSAIRNSNGTTSFYDGRGRSPGRASTPARGDEQREDIRLFADRSDCAVCRVRHGTAPGDPEPGAAPRGDAALTTISSGLKAETSGRQWIANQMSLIRIALTGLSLLVAAPCMAQGVPDAAQGEIPTCEGFACLDWDRIILEWIRTPGAIANLRLDRYSEGFGWAAGYFRGDVQGRRQGRKPSFNSRTMRLGLYDGGGLHPASSVLRAERVTWIPSGARRTPMCPIYSGRNG